MAKSSLLTGLLSDYFSKTSDGIVFVGSDGVVLELNSSAKSLFVGLSVASSLSEVLDSQGQKWLASLFAGDFGDSATTFVMTRNGLCLFVEAVSLISSEPTVQESISDRSPPTGRVFSFSFRGHETNMASAGVASGASRENSIVSRRLASVGRLASNIAHKINNPLAVIDGRVELWTQIIESGRELKPNRVLKHLSTIQDNATRIGTMVQSLQEFAAPTLIGVRQCQMGDVLTTVQEKYGRQFDKIKISVSESVVTFSINVDERLLAQLFANLFIHIAECSPPETVVTVNASYSSENGFEIVIKDEGNGISDSVLSVLRSPYSDEWTNADPNFSVGLAMVWAITQDHKGSFTVENRVGGGTTYFLMFPEVCSQALTKPPEVEISVLVVDDDPDVRETVCTVLEFKGYKVTSVESAEDALTTLAKESFDMVVSDIRLPNMGGDGLASAIEQRWPHLGGRVILISGLLHKPSRQYPYLQKPFSPKQLIQIVERVYASNS